MKDQLNTRRMWPVSPVFCARKEHKVVNHKNKTMFAAKLISAFVFYVYTDSSIPLLSKSI